MCPLYKAVSTQITMFNTVTDEAENALTTYCLYCALFSRSHDINSTRVTTHFKEETTVVIGFTKLIDC